MRIFQYNTAKSTTINLRKNKYTFDTDLNLKLLDTPRKQNIFSSRKKNQLKNSSKVYFYCPFNQTHTNYEDYNISTILELICKYQLENYFIIQIDNDNLLYEEILKIQFNNEFQNIHKMFDLELDYSFSPFYDSLFFNMSILTDFFYDQMEKYHLQIFFHQHGIYIINKDSCENIHEILIEKFSFNYVKEDDFFEKAIKDKKTKYKNKEILINDLKLKKIIQNNQYSIDLFKSNKNNGRGGLNFFSNFSRKIKNQNSKDKSINKK